MTIPLSAIAHGRSGDKGNHANVAVIAYTPEGYPWIREHLTADVEERYFAELGPSRIERFEAANVRGVNFVLYDVLAGGASRSCGAIPRAKPWPSGCYGWRCRDRRSRSSFSPDAGQGLL